MRIIGYTAGVYDLFHIGHVNVLKRAKAACDHLIVAVTTDELALQQKGRLPVIPFAERCAIVSSVRWVDQVVPQTSMDKLGAWRAHRFHRMFVGDDWKGTPRWTELERRFEPLGVEIVYFPYTEHTSSTKLRAILERL